MNETISNFDVNAFADQLVSGILFDNILVWIVVALVQALILAGGVLLAGRVSQVGKVGELKAIESRFHHVLSQIEAQQRVEKVAELRKELLLRLRSAMAEMYVAIHLIGDRLVARESLIERLRKVVIELQTCRIATTPETMVKVTAFSKKFALILVRLGKVRTDLDSLIGDLKDLDAMSFGRDYTDEERRRVEELERDSHKLSSDLQWHCINAQLEIDADLCAAESGIRRDLGFADIEAFEKSARIDPEGLKSLYQQEFLNQC